MNLKVIWTTTKKLWLLYFDFYIVSQMLPTRKWQNLLYVWLLACVAWVYSYSTAQSLSTRTYQEESISLHRIFLDSQSYAG